MRTGRISFCILYSLHVIHRHITNEQLPIQTVNDLYTYYIEYMTIFYNYCENSLKKDDERGLKIQPVSFLSSILMNRTTMKLILFIMKTSCWSNWKSIQRGSIQYSNRTIEDEKFFLSEKRKELSIIEQHELILQSIHL